MNVEVFFISETKVLSVSGRVDSGNAKAFEEAVLPEVKTANKGIVVDCRALDYISSAGLRVFLMAAKSAQQAGRQLSVCCLNDDISSLFAITGFDSIIRIELNKDRAIANLEESATSSSPFC